MACANVVSFRKQRNTQEAILAPTDGSALSLAGALKAVDFAKRLEARLVVLSSIPAYQYPIYVGGIPFEYPSESEYEAQCRAIAGRYLGLVMDVAREQGVAATQRTEFNGNAAQAILRVAQDEQCTLIVMSSHGRSGLSRMFLGSVAIKTLTMAHIPVLVDRPTPDEVAQIEVLMKENAIES
jgi:nucleotide-binding universal stress UspA family protein